MNKWSLTLLVLLTAAIIVALIFTSQLSFWNVLTPLLSIVLGWLLKTINDSITISQQHQWELEKIAQERTLKYYEAKLGEMSAFVADELSRLVSSDWSSKSSNDKSKYTKEWVGLSSSTRTFVEIVGDSEMTSAYTEIVDQSSKWLTFVNEFNAGKFNTYNHEQTQLRIQEEMGSYISKLKNIQTTIERVRLKVLRGEIVLNQKS